MEKRSPGIVWCYSSLATYVVPVNEGVEENTMVCPKFTMVKFLIITIMIIIVIIIIIII